MIIISRSHVQHAILAWVAMISGLHSVPAADWLFVATEMKQNIPLGSFCVFSFFQHFSQLWTYPLVYVFPNQVTIFKPVSFYFPLSQIVIKNSVQRKIQIKLVWKKFKPQHIFHCHDLHSSHNTNFTFFLKFLMVFLNLHGCS